MGKPVSKKSVSNTVDRSIVETSIEGKAIGQKIRKLRLKRSMSLVELGRRTALSASFLSQIETGRVVPTLKNLASIAMVFGKEFSYFFSPENANVFRISRAKSRIRLPVGEKGAPFLISESLSVLIPDRNVVPCIADFLPGVESAAFHPEIFHGLELVYVIHGSLTLSTQTEKQILEASDSAWIDAAGKRQYQCHGNKPARAMIVTFPARS